MRQQQHFEFKVPRQLLSIHRTETKYYYLIWSLPAFPALHNGHKYASEVEAGTTNGPDVALSTASTGLTTGRSVLMTANKVPDFPLFSLLNITTGPPAAPEWIQQFWRTLWRSLPLVELYNWIQWQDSKFRKLRMIFCPLGAQTIGIKRNETPAKFYDSTTTRL